MKREDVIQMGVAAGWQPEFAINREVRLFGVDMERLQRFADLVEAREREACAMLCHEIWYAGWNSPDDAAKCADAIRARGKA